MALGESFSVIPTAEGSYPQCYVASLTEDHHVLSNSSSFGIVDRG